MRTRKQKTLDITHYGAYAGETGELLQEDFRQLRRKVPYAGHLMTPRRLWLNKIPTQCDVVIEFPEDAPDEALRWLLARIRSQPPAGLGLVVQERQWLVLQVLQGLRAGQTDIEACRTGGSGRGSKYCGCLARNRSNYTNISLHETKTLTHLQYSWVRIGFRWGTLSTPPELLEPPRPLYKGPLVENNVTGRLEPKEAPAWKRRLSVIWSAFPLLVCVCSWYSWSCL
ncbi:hypothetical protein EVAR_91211_1 [Eumeta japonica]|uniref:Uncharacterized protein n=1 Tax=Eumeta variegata TaxID=151549 RepID=A0A4C1SI81_EUMVA|nr:hypothetical protein EVAR_91211_1 [Eumeta japonica]